MTLNDILPKKLYVKWYLFFNINTWAIFLKVKPKFYEKIGKNTNCACAASGCDGLMGSASSPDQCTVGLQISKKNIEYIHIDYFKKYLYSYSLYRRKNIEYIQYRIFLGYTLKIPYNHEKVGLLFYQNIIKLLKKI